MTGPKASSERWCAAIRPSPATAGTPRRPSAGSGRCGPRRSARSRPVAFEVGAQVLLDPGQGEDDAALRQLLAQVLERVDGGDVDLDDRLGVEHEPPHRVRGARRPRPGRGGGSPRRWRRTAASRSGRPAAPGPPVAPRVVVDVVHAGEAGHEALDGVVRPGDAAQQVEDRQPDGDQHAGEHADHQHGGGGGQRRAGARCAGTAPAGGTRRRRPAGSRRTRRPRRGRRSGRRRAAAAGRARRATVRGHGDQAGELGAAADGVADRGAAAAAADREAVHQARRRGWRRRARAAPAWRRSRSPCRSANARPVRMLSV